MTINTLQNKFKNVFNFFLLHEFIIRLFYGKVKKQPFVFYLPEKLNVKLIDLLSKTNFINFDLNLTEKNLVNFDDEVLGKINTNLIFYDLQKSDISTELVDFITKSIKDIVKSPFVVINLRGWISKPKSEKFGPNSLHLDGFAPGHIKVMIYPNMLNKENGMLEVEGKLYTDSEPGCCVLFHNSDLLHRGIPGELNNRISLELTIFRTLKKNEKINFYGKPSDRHYVNVYKYYKSQIT